MGLAERSGFATLQASGYTVPVAPQFTPALCSASAAVLPRHHGPRRTLGVRHPAGIRLYRTG
ncbi:hypothetical protein C6P47_29690, partial [Klebsiella pneumoniae]